MVTLTDFGGLFVLVAGMDVDEFEGEEVVALFGGVAFGGPAGEGRVEEVVDGCALALEDGGEEDHIVMDEECIWSESGFVESGFDHFPIDGLEGIALHDFGVDLLIDLFAEVAEFFDTFVIDADEVDGFGER